MAEYIDRESLINHVEDLPTWGADGNLLDREDVICSIENRLAADVAPVVHGMWNYYHKQGKAVCTNCSFERSVDDNFGRAVACPNCGAKMDGGVD